MQIPKTDGPPCLSRTDGLDTGTPNQFNCYM